MDKIEAYYNKFKEEKRLSTRHGKIEFTITMKYIHECLDKLKQCYEFDGDNDNNKIKILDVGAGTGRYSLALAEEGYDVSALEYVKRNVDIIKSMRSTVKARQGTAVDLSHYDDESMDVTLVFGPMYHLFSIEERVQALKEAKRVTKKGGYILVAYCMNDYGVVVYGFFEGNAAACVKDGRLSEDFHCEVKGPGDLYEFARIEDINELNEKAELNRVKIITPDGPANYMRTVTNAMDDETYDIYVRYIMSISERQDMIGAAAHTVDILRK